MSSFNDIYKQLRRKNKENYSLIFFCNFISVLLISSFAVVMQSNTVQKILPVGGDSRKQMTMIFILAIVGCAVFTIYASSLFFRSKSREMGIYMALGAKKKQLSRLIYSDVALIAIFSSLSGAVLSMPFSAGIWKIFQLLLPANTEMKFSPNGSAYLWSLGFILFTTAVLFLMGRRFIKRSNIIDIINEQRKTEQAKEVKRWFGAVGAIFMVAGVIVAVALPNILADMGYTPPIWGNLFYVLSAAGLYMLLLFIVNRGFGGRQKYYKNIITRSIMKFQSRQTVLNMCVITVLIMAMYFSVFYSPVQYGNAKAEINTRGIGYSFHHRADETAIPGRDEIERLAGEYEIDVLDYTELSFISLATDGFEREWTDDGRFGDEYFELYNEECFMSESVFTELSGIEIDVLPGKYVFVSVDGYSHSPYDYIEDMSLFTNPDTMESISSSFQEEIHYGLMHRYILLDDGDYAAIEAGLTDEWRESWIQFNAAESEREYEFAAALKNEIIDASTEKSAVYENYDRIERMNVLAAGEEYLGDTNPDRQVDYAQRASSRFNDSWRYIPKFSALDNRDSMINMAVYLMLFVFMAIICFSAVVVIAYTRCLTIAANNRKVFEDLKKLGAKPDYLQKSIKGLVSKVYTIPAVIGTVGISGFFVLIMYSNSGGFEPAELIAFSINGGMVAAISVVFWLIYRRTLRTVIRSMEI